MHFKKAVIRIGIEIDCNVIFDSTSKFLLEAVYKIRDPAIEVVIVTVRDKNVVFEARDNGRHITKVNKLVGSAFFPCRDVIEDQQKRQRRDIHSQQATVPLYSS